ncbi:trehalase [Tribolium castaneum]|uniref:trehalase n=1 Tax=Tribolium castaneum TaxID=7070 RepID=UPI0030FE0E60
MLFLLLLTLSFVTSEPCTSLIYCHGPLLHMVQTARIFPDSKIFVDMKMQHDEKTTLENFHRFIKTTNKPNRKEIKRFVNENFKHFQEFDDWTPPDFRPNPDFLNRIRDPEIRDFAHEVVQIWPKLSRKIKREVLESAELFSLLPVPNGFVVPGGRFREFYYWDSYWILKGLLLCQMHQTVRGILDNFAFIIQKYGFLPNGARVYYLNRSQPPLLSLMVGEYLRATNDTEWLRENIVWLDRELQFFLENKLTTLVKNGVKYQLAHYVAKSDTPRPESYFEDIKSAKFLHSPEARAELWTDLKSAAESGWDFSSRWMVDHDGGTKTNLSHIQTRRIVPVDLNAFLCQAFGTLSGFYTTLGDHKRALFWLQKSHLWRQNLELVFYDHEDGVWYDWDRGLNQPRKGYYASNLTPLWTQCYDPNLSDHLGQKAVQYLSKTGILDFDGGIPASLVNSGEQWDFPNAWPPLQSIVILGLDHTGHPQAQKTAQDLAEKWIRSNLDSFKATGQISEKYDVQFSGHSGRGGEYSVQHGFGWTNGVLLELIDRYYGREK